MSGFNGDIPRGVLRIKHGDTVTTSKQFEMAIND